VDAAEGAAEGARVAFGGGGELMAPQGSAEEGGEEVVEGSGEGEEGGVAMGPVVCHKVQVGRKRRISALAAAAVPAAHQVCVCICVCACACSFIKGCLWCALRCKWAESAASLPLLLLLCLLHTRCVCLHLCVCVCV
jgi:hypothetical protein